MLIVERWLLGRLRRRIFHGLAEINAAIEEMLKNLNEERPIRRLGVTHRKLFEEVDRPAMKALPIESYEYREWRLRRVGIDYHVEIDAHYYSAPYRFARAEEVKRRMHPLFTQERMARSAEDFLDELLGDEWPKTGWMRAEAAGDRGPWRQQAVLGRGRRDADALRDIVRDYALATLADDGAVLVTDETGFLTQGKASCGVARQYTGSAGKITDC